jgi:hypothetical protein
LPFGWTTGCPPTPLPPGNFGVPQVRPPSVEVLIVILESSHSW